jgi:hypothetical protein
MRFNLIRQVANSVKLDPETGEMTEAYEDESCLDPFHTPYTGPSYRIQCGVCGLIAEEEMFIKRAEFHRFQR